MWELLTNGATVPFSSMPKLVGLEQLGAQRTDVFHTHNVLELYIFWPSVQWQFLCVQCIEGCRGITGSIFYHSAKLMKILAYKTFLLEKAYKIHRLETHYSCADSCWNSFFLDLSCNFFFLKTFLQTGFYLTFDRHWIKNKKLRCCGNHSHSCVGFQGHFLQIFFISSPYFKIFSSSSWSEKAPFCCLQG